MKPAKVSVIAKLFLRYLRPRNGRKFKEVAFLSVTISASFHNLSYQGQHAAYQ